ncbi:sn-1-specific diacylglycerol lipase ABHD11-like [Artemia franciscana]|uniref:sn-1-specific diacylglycerol lipase ABHD11 n=1 Tax=Artemia franciscana TaxID=6661 RepID=A0AA88ICR9_ARTSF|nr:hypothetical protein QYM36_000586 [Artemia franciscana]
MNSRLFTPKLYWKIFSDFRRCKGNVSLAYNSYESTLPLGHPEETNSPIIIMHGLLGSKTNWTSLAKVIHMKTKRQVITIDARNHGESPHTKSISYNEMAEDIMDLMDSLMINQATLVGHSMGGRTMMTLALTEPEVVNQLVVVDISPIDTSPVMGDLSRIIEGLQHIRLPEKLSRLAAKKEVDKQLMEIVTSDMLRQFLMTNLVEDNGTFKWRVNLRTIAKDFLNIVNFPKFESRFEGETLFIGGSRSDYIRRDHHESIRRLFPRCEFTYVDGAGHWVHSEKPKEFLDELLQFLTRKRS